MVKRAKLALAAIIKKGMPIVAVLCVLAVVGAVAVDTKAETTECTLNVKGGDDITSALQSAIKSYDKVIIPEGTYYCSSVKLNGIDGVTISAVGATIIQSGSTNPIIFVSNGAVASNVTIQGGTWNGNGIDMPVFRFYGTCDNVTLSNVTVKNSANAGIRFSGSSSVFLEGVTSVDNTGYAVIFENSSNINVSNSTFKNSKTGIYFKSCSGEVVASNVECTGNTDRAILSELTPNIVIKNSELNDNAEGIRISGATGVVSLDTNNIKNNAGMGIRIFDCTAKIDFARVYAYDNAKSGFSMENCTGNVKMYKAYAKRNLDSGFTIKNCPDISMDTCVSSDNSNYGYNLDCSSDTVITMVSCQATSNKNIGIRAINCKSLDIDKATVESNVGSGIYVNGVSDKVTITNSELNSNTEGLRISGSKAEINLDTNNIKNNSEMGLRIFDCTGKINFARIYAYDNGKSGFSMENCTGAVKMYKAYAKGNLDSGFTIAKCTNITFDTCVASDNTNYGYNIDCSAQTNTTMTDCQALTNGNIGIRVVGGSNIIVKGTTSENNSGAGIYVGMMSGSISISDVSLANNKGYGINLYSNTGNGTLTNVSSIGNADSGYMVNVCTNIVINNSISKENGAHGVYVLNSVSTLNNVQVSKSYWCGLSVSGEKANVTVNGGSYNNNGTRPDKFAGDDSLCAGIGIYEGAIGTLKEVSCLENHGCGLAIAASDDGSNYCKAYIYGCTFNNNNDHGIGARPYSYVDITSSSSGKNTVINNNKHHGIMLNDNSTSEYINNCEISNNGKAGISIGENSSAEDISNCIISSNGEDGIHIASSSSANIKKCIISDNLLCGIGGYSLSIVTVSDDCQVLNNGSYGICIDQTAAPYIKNTVIKGNEKAGLVVRNGIVVLLKDCMVLTNGTYGVYVSEGGNLTADSIYVVANKSDGIRVTGDNSAATIGNATVAGNASKTIVAAQNGVITKLDGIVEQKELPELKVTFNADVDFNIVGATVNFKADVVGGIGTYTYTYLVYNESANEWNTLKEKSDLATYSWKSKKAGTRYFYVEVTDLVGTTVRSEGVKIVSAKEKTLSATAVANKDTVAIGESVTFTASATGGEGPYKYSIIVYNNTTKEWARLVDKSTSNTYTWKAKKAGDRDFYVDVTDASGKTVRCEVLKVVTPSNELKATAKVTATETSIGDSITFTTTATGGQGPYKYSVIVYNKTTKKWARLVDMSSSNTYTWKAKSAGDREFYIDVTDASGKTIRCKALTVVTKSNELSVTSTATTSTSKVGQNITFSTVATGGQGSYKYSVIVYNETTGKWARLVDKGNSSTYTWKAKTAGVRYFYIDVTDESGKTVRSQALKVVTE